MKVKEVIGDHRETKDLQVLEAPSEAWAKLGKKVCQVKRVWKGGLVP